MAGLLAVAGLGLRRLTRRRRPGDHHVRPSRNSAAYQDFLQRAQQANPEGAIYVITDNLSSHDSKSTRAWLEDHPRIRHAFIPKGACWLNLQEGWWRIFRKTALAGQSFADPDEIAHATQVATT